MFKFFFGNLVFKLYLRFFVPPNLWYACRHSCAIIVVRAREAESLIRSARAIFEFGEPRRLEVFRGSTPFFIFSNFPGYHEPSGMRGGGYAVGSLAEFEHFCWNFHVECLPLSVPPPKSMPLGTSDSYGRMSVENDFNIFLTQAAAMCHSRRKKEEKSKVSNNNHKRAVVNNDWPGFLL